MIDSVEKYRLFDLILLSVIAVVCEIVGEILHITLPGAGYYLSFSILIALIAMIRWGKWGAVVYIVAGIPMIFLHNSTVIENIMLYPIANAFIAVSCIVFRFVDRDRIKDNIIRLFLFTVTAYLSVSIGKGVGIFILTGVFGKSAAYYFLTQLFNMTMVFLILIIIKHRNGLLVNMNTYLLQHGQKV